MDMTMNTTSDPYPAVCFPPPGSFFIQINFWNRGFYAQFLLTKYWAEFPKLLATLYVFGSIQLALALLGMFMAMARTTKHKNIYAMANKKIVFFLNSFWQFALSGLILFVPTQWLSNLTFGTILFHSYGEFFSLVMRFLIVQRRLNNVTFAAYLKWCALATFFTIVPFSLGSNPYAQGLITIIFVLPADFLNLVVAPYLSVKWLQMYPKEHPSMKASEVLIGILNVVHVIWFYGQGLMGCLVSPYAGAQYFVAVQIISTAVFAGAVISYAVTINKQDEWQHPFREFAELFECCCSPQYNDANVDNEDHAGDAGFQMLEHGSP